MNLLDLNRPKSWKGLIMNETKSIFIDDEGTACNANKDSIYCPQARTENANLPCTNRCAWFSMDNRNIIRCQTTVLGTAVNGES